MLLVLALLFTVTSWHFYCCHLRHWANNISYAHNCAQIFVKLVSFFFPEYKKLYYKLHNISSSGHLRSYLWRCSWCVAALWIPRCSHHLPSARTAVHNFLIGSSGYIKQFSSGCISICSADDLHILKAGEPCLIGCENNTKRPSASRAWLRRVYVKHLDVDCDHLSSMFKLYPE